MFQAPMMSQKALERNSKVLDIARHEIKLDSVEFGIIGRDEVTFSSEWKRTYTSG